MRRHCRRLRTKTLLVVVQSGSATSRWAVSLSKSLVGFSAIRLGRHNGLDFVAACSCGHFCIMVYLTAGGRVEGAASKVSNQGVTVAPIYVIAGMPLGILNLLESDQFLAVGYF